MFGIKNPWAKEAPEPVVEAKSKPITARDVRNAEAARITNKQSLENSNAVLGVINQQANELAEELGTALAGATELNTTLEANPNSEEIQAAVDLAAENKAEIEKINSLVQDLVANLAQESDPLIKLNTPIVDPNAGTNPPVNP